MELQDRATLPLNPPRDARSKVIEVCWPALMVTTGVPVERAKSKGSIVSANGADVEVANPLPGVSWAVIEWTPIPSTLVEIVAASAASEAEPMAVCPSKKVTAPVGTPPAELETPAVNVTTWPNPPGLMLEVTAIVVGATMTTGTTFELLMAKLESPP